MIVIENISKQYNKQFALESVDAVIEKNRITGLIGPNGAGKSTLMKLICGYISPTSGNIIINDKEVNINNYEIKKIIGYLPENNPLYTDMYVKEYLHYIAGIYKLENKKEKIKEIIELTGLAKEQHKKIEALSKGYRQRVGLAQAIIHDPEVLILDEPTSGLDPNQIVDIRNLISELGKNKTVMLSTHILQEVEAICDSVLLLNNGKIITHDKTSNIQNNKNKNLVVEFDQNPLRQELLEIEGVVEARNPKNNIWIITSSENTDIRSAIFKFAVSKSLVVLSSQVQEMKLEEFFQSLTKKN